MCFTVGSAHSSGVNPSIATKLSFALDSPVAVLHAVGFRLDPEFLAGSGEMEQRTDAAECAIPLKFRNGSAVYVCDPDTCSIESYSLRGISHVERSKQYAVGGA